MFEDEQLLLNKLRLKKKLTGGERAKIKALERKEKQAQREIEVTKTKPNVFAIKPTTKLKPLPIRFSSDERAGLTELANDIKAERAELIVGELGSLREINDTKLIRAAIHLLKQHSHCEIIDAIKQVKMNMIR